VHAIGARKCAVNNYIEYQKTQWLNVDISYKCILGCSACMRNILEDPAKKESDSLRYFKTKLNQSDDISVLDLHKLADFFPKISFCGGLSDPVYHSQFIDLLKITNDLPNKFRVHTAAHQKNLEWYESAFQANKKVEWIFGIDGLEDTSPMYRKRQDTGLMLQAMKLCSAIGLKTEWQFIVFDHNNHQINKAKEICKENYINLRLHYSRRNLSGKFVLPRSVNERYKFWVPLEQRSSLVSV